MNMIFLKILNMSITASWIVLTVMVLRLLMKRAPRWITIVMWGFVGIRLICPFSFESVFSLIPSAETVQQTGFSGLPFEIKTGFGQVDGVVNHYLSSSYYEGVSVSAGHFEHMITILSILWMTGMAVMLLYTLISCLQMSKKLSEAIPIEKDFTQPAGKYRKGTSAPVLLCDHVDTPFIFGVTHPRIYLPSSLRERDMEYVIAHEKAHLKRRDHWWKPLGFLLLTIHWFNPLLWAAYLLFSRDMEFACDERVIKTMDKEQKKRYSDALIHCSVPKSALAACPLAFGEVSVKNRIQSVLHYKKPAFWIILVSIAACILLAVCFLTNPGRDDFDISIRIPAGSEETFVYSHEEISPTRSQIIITAGENLGDTEVILEPVEVQQENAYDEATYLTPGFPVKLNAEKGAWFKIGVNVQNPTDEDMIVYVNVKHVEVRIE